MFTMSDIFRWILRDTHLSVRAASPLLWVSTGLQPGSSCPKVSIICIHVLLHIYFCLYNQAVIFVTVFTFFSVGVHRESCIHASNSICIPLCIYIFILGGHLMPPPGLPSCPRAGPMPLGLNLRLISRIKLFRILTAFIFNSSIMTWLEKLVL